MYSPRKINLYLENELPTFSLKQKGGFIDDKLINNNQFKYLRADKTVETFINGSSKIEENVELWFEFNNEIMNNDDVNKNLYYMERTNNSISFSITQLQKYSNVTIKKMPKHNLILKLVELTYEDSDFFIENWKSNKTLFDVNIPDIYMYGNLYTKEGTFICNYYITKKYKNHLQLLKIDYEFTIKYVIKLLIFIEKCIEKNIVLRNLKFSGIGYEFINSEIEFILLDYNDLSMIKKNENYFKLFKDGCDAMCAGTLIPYFIIYDFFEMNSEWLDKLDKLYVIGLAEILIFLLYSQDKIMENLFSILYNPSYLKPCLHYYHYMKIFDDPIKRDEFNQLLNTLQPKFIEIESKIIAPMFLRILYNCFEKKYNAVKTPISYLGHIREVYGNYEQMKKKIKVYIKPIGTITTQNSTVLGNNSKVDSIQLDIKTDKYKINSSVIQTNKDDESEELVKLETNLDIGENKDMSDYKMKIMTDINNMDKGINEQSLEMDLVDIESDKESDKESVVDIESVKESDKESVMDNSNLEELENIVNTDDIIEINLGKDEPLPKSILKKGGLSKNLYKRVDFVE